MKALRVSGLFIAYCALVWVLFLGIRSLEHTTREMVYNHVTRRLVARKAHVPIETCMLGIYKPELPYSFRLLHELEDSLDRRFTLVSFYQAWGSGPEHRFQPILMDNIVENGRVPVLTWEPWVSGFAGDSLEPMPEREWRCLRDIADGVYDFHIARWARAAVAWGHPFFLRFAHEMTNPQYPWSPANGNTPRDYREAWWHVHGLFDSLGASNVIWVWCPHGTGVAPYYPGDAYVDWVAMDVFNYGEMLFGEGRRWLSFDELASPLYAELEPLRKPIMVAEAGCSDIGGSREVWYREMLEHIRRKFTSVKALVFYDNPSDRTSGRWEIDWSIGERPDVLAEVRAQIGGGYYRYVNDYLKKLSGTGSKGGTHAKRQQ